MTDSELFIQKDLPVNWHQEYITPNLIQAEKILRIYYEKQTKYQHAVIMEGACFGRSLVLDGKTQSTERDEFIYHEALVHPTMLSHPCPKRIFIGGGGEGATAREVLKHKSVERVVMVDIDKEVVSACRKYLPNHHQGSFDDERMEIIFEDALEFLLSTDELFDVAIIDVPDPLESGPAHKVFTMEFYRVLIKRLTSSGVMVSQSGPTGPGFYAECFTAVANTIRHAFPAFAAHHVFVPAFASTWGFTQGSMNSSAFNTCSKDVNTKLAHRNVAGLKMYDGITHEGLFSLPVYLRRAIDNETRIITESEPLFVF